MTKRNRLFRKETFWIRPSLLWIFISISTIFLLTNPAWAQLIHKLSESEIRSVIPILKAEVAAYSQFKEAQKDDNLARKKLFEEIKSGKIDPLDWLKKHSKYIIVPPGVVYQPECSRTASILGGLTLQSYKQPDDISLDMPEKATPTAIFTFGKEIRAINKQWLIKFSKNDTSYNNDFLYDVNDPSYNELRSILENARSFYSKRGFSAEYDETGDNIIFEPLDAEGEIIGYVASFYGPSYNPYFMEFMKACASLPIGPIIEIEAGDKLMEKVFKQKEIKLGTDNSEVKRCLKKCGITEEQYGEIKGALQIAREGSKNPEEEEPQPLDITPTTPEEKQAVQEYERTRQMMIEEIKIKKNNIELYKKYKAELDPVLDGL